MEALIIEADGPTMKLIRELVERLGGKASQIDHELFEDLALGKLMERDETDELVSEEEIMKILKVNENPI